MIKKLILLMGLITASLFSYEGKVEKGYYYSPTKSFKVKSPVSPGNFFRDNIAYFPDGNKRNGIESVCFSYDGYWAIQGMWSLSHVALKTSPEAIVKGAKVDLVPKLPMQNVSLVFEGQKDINGRFVYMCYYKGTLEKQQAGCITAAMMYDSERMAFFDAVFPLGSDEQNSKYLEKFMAFLGSYEYLK